MTKSERKQQKKLDQIAKEARAAVMARKKSGVSKRQWQKQYGAMLKTETNNEIPSFNGSLSGVATSGVATTKSVFDSEWQESKYDDPEMAAREMAAVEEAKQKAKQVGMAYSKGPAMYITNPKNLKGVHNKEGRWE